MNPSHSFTSTNSDKIQAIPKRIIKRNLQAVDFDSERLNRTLSTIRKQYKEYSKDKQARLQAQILRYLKYHQGGAPEPSVLQLQDAIEQSLFSNAYYKSAKYFISHRAEKRILRQQRQHLKFLIRAIHDEINHKPTSQTHAINPALTTTVCLSLFAQMVHQTPDSLTEQPELSAALKEHIRSVPSDDLMALLTEIEGIIG